jgi:cytidyltransferase-like protein
MTGYVLALGNFDGIHLGHQELIKEAQRLAKELSAKPAVLTFNPHPNKLLKTNLNFQEITNLKDKKFLVKSLGLEDFFVINFSEDFSYKKPETFLEELFFHYSIKGLVTGEDFRFGHKRAGSAETIAQFSKNKSIVYKAIRRLSYQNIRLSSSLLRDIVKVGAVKLFKKLTGRNYSLEVKIDWSNKLGSFVDKELLIPPPGAFLAFIKGGVFLLICLPNKEFFLEELDQNYINNEIEEERVELLEFLGEGLDKGIKNQLVIENLIKNAKFILKKYDF